MKQMIFPRISREKNCPVCKSAEVYRIKRAGLTVKVACRLLDLRPHWCQECDTFFLGPKQGNRAGSGETFELTKGRGESNDHAGLPTTLKEKAKGAAG
jgi:hypothetical protein